MSILSNKRRELVYCGKDCGFGPRLLQDEITSVVAVADRHAAVAAKAAATVVFVVVMMFLLSLPLVDE